MFISLRFENNMTVKIKKRVLNLLCRQSADAGVNIRLIYAHDIFRVKFIVMSLEQRMSVNLRP